MIDALQRIWDAVERERQSILRTLQAVDGMPEGKRLDLVLEWLKRARAAYQIQNTDLYRLHVRRAVAMLVCGLLKTGATPEEGNPDAETTVDGPEQAYSADG
jgi:hypothetical protein